MTTPSLASRIIKVAEITRFQVDGKTDARKAAKDFHGVGQHIPFSGQRRKFHNDTGMRRGQYRSGVRADRQLATLDPKIHEDQIDSARAYAVGDDKRFNSLQRRRVRQSEYQTFITDGTSHNVGAISLNKRNRDKMVRLNMTNKSPHGRSDHFARGYNGRHDWGTGNVGKGKLSKKELAALNKRESAEKVAALFHGYVEGVDKHAGRVGAVLEAAKKQRLKVGRAAGLGRLQLATRARDKLARKYYAGLLQDARLRDIKNGSQRAKGFHAKLTNHVARETGVKLAGKLGDVITRESLAAARASRQSGGTFLGSVRLGLLKERRGRRNAAASLQRARKAGGSAGGVAKRQELLDALM